MSRKRLSVIETEEEAEASFAGYGETIIDVRLMEKIHGILSTETEYAYLDDESKGVLTDLRSKAKRYHMTEEICRDQDGSLLLIPSLSGKTMLTVYHILRAHDVMIRETKNRPLFPVSHFKKNFNRFFKIIML